MITNGGFEVEGTLPGLAEGWDSQRLGAGERFADFAGNSGDATVAVEDHERGWASEAEQVTVLSLGRETEATEAATFHVGPSQRPVEDHEMGWGEPPLWAPQLSAMALAVFDGADHEAHDWLPHVPALADPDITAASFSGFDEERHEAGWAAPLIAAFAPADLSAAFTENYEKVYQATVVTVLMASDTPLLAASVPAIPFVAGEKVFFENEGGTLPEPLNPGVGYFVLSPSGAQFRPARTPGGSGLDLSVGEGTHRVTRDPAVYWSRVMATV